MCVDLFCVHKLRAHVRRRQRKHHTISFARCLRVRETHALGEGGIGVARVVGGAVKRVVKGVGEDVDGERGSAV